jgi:hypothetical protein
MRVAHILAEVDTDEDVIDPWCFKLFVEQELRAFAAVMVGLLYPILLGLTLLGSVWYAEVREDTSCFANLEQNWYVFLWLIIFYVWVVAYTTAIIASSIVFVVVT